MDVKKQIVTLLITAFALTGCSYVTEGSYVMPEGYDESAMESAVARRTQDVIDDAWDARLGFDGSGLDAVPSVNLSELYVDGTDYPNLSSAVQDFESELFDSHISDPSYLITRCDNRVLSIRVAADNDYYCGTWDYEGNRLYFDDIVNDCDYFIYTLSPLISVSLPQDTSVEVEEIIANLLVSHEQEDFDFYLTKDYLCFFLDYVEMSGEDREVSNRRVEIRVNYQEYADYFNPQYLPGEGTIVSAAQTFEIESAMDVDEGYRYDDHFDVMRSGMFVYNFNGHNYVVFDMTSSQDSSSITLVYDVDSGDFVSEEVHDGIHSFESTTDVLSYITDRV